jgi:hypothetical protein
MRNDGGFYLMPIENKDDVSVFVKCFNENYFEKGIDAVDNIGYSLKRFGESEFEDFIEFLTDSVVNNIELCDVLSVEDFEIEGNEIVLQEKANEKPLRYINMAELSFGGYDVAICDNRLFIKKIDDESVSFFYYGD